MGAFLIVCFGEDSRAVGRELAARVQSAFASAISAPRLVVACRTDDGWLSMEPVVAGQTPLGEQAGQVIFKEGRYDDWHGLQHAIQWAGEWWADCYLVVLASCRLPEEWEELVNDAGMVHRNLDTAGHLPMHSRRIGILLIPKEFWITWHATANNALPGCRVTLLATDAVAQGNHGTPKWPDEIRQTVGDWLFGWCLAGFKGLQHAGKPFSFGEGSGEVSFGSLCVARQQYLNYAVLRESFGNACLRALLHKGEPANKDLTTSPVAIPLEVTAATNTGTDPFDCVALPWKTGKLVAWLKGKRISCGTILLNRSQKWQDTLLNHRRTLDAKRVVILRQLGENLMAAETAALACGGIGEIEKLVVKLKQPCEQAKSSPSEIAWQSAKYYDKIAIDLEIESHWNKFSTQIKAVSVASLLAKRTVVAWVVALGLLISAYYVEGWLPLGLALAGIALGVVPFWLLWQKRSRFRKAVEAAHNEVLKVVNKYFGILARDQWQAANDRNRSDFSQLLQRRIDNWEKWVAGMRTRMANVDAKYPAAPQALSDRVRRNFPSHWERFVKGLGKTEDVVSLFDREVIDPLLETCEDYLRREWPEGMNARDEKLVVMLKAWRQWPRLHPLLAPVNYAMVRAKPLLVFQYGVDAQVQEIPDEEKCSLLPDEGLYGEYIILGVHANLGLTAFREVSPTMEGRKT